MSFETKTPDGNIPGADMKAEIKDHFSALLSGELEDSDRNTVQLAESVMDSFTDESCEQFFTVVYPPDELSRDWLLKLAAYVNMAQGVQFKEIDDEQRSEVQEFGEELLGLRKAIVEHNERVMGDLDDIAAFIEGAKASEHEQDDGEDPPIWPSEKEVDERLKNIMRIAYLASVGDAHLDDEEAEMTSSDDWLIRFLLQYEYAVTFSLNAGEPYMGIEVDDLITKYETSSMDGGLATHLRPLHKERSAIENFDELYEMYTREAANIEGDYDRKVAAFAMLHVSGADDELSDGEAHVFNHIFHELWGMSEDDFEEVRALIAISQVTFN